MNGYGSVPEGSRGVTLSLKNTEAVGDLRDLGDVVGRAVILDHIGKTFTKTRFGQTSSVILKEVGKRDVKLAEAGRVDTFRISIKEFLKFYKPA